MSNKLISKIVGKTSPDSMKDSEFFESLEKFAEYTKIRNPSTKFSEIDKQFSFVYDTQTLIGIEIEAEGLKNKIVLPTFWKSKGDGSLRKGTEFYSVPLTPRQAFYATSCLYSVLAKSGKKPQFSWRTSIHDHLNVLDLDEDRLKNLLVLSILFENLLFKFVGDFRDQCVFCVPLAESSCIFFLTNYFQGKYSLGMLAQEKWGKYTAVNIKRLVDCGPEAAALGTVEFRHLGGTANLPRVLTWHGILLQIYRAAVNRTPEELKQIVFDLSSPIAYQELVASVFSSGTSTTLLNDLDYRSLFAGPISRAKELFRTPLKMEPMKQKSALASYANYIHKKNLKKDPKKPTKQIFSAEGFTTSTSFILDEE